MNLKPDRFIDEAIIMTGYWEKNITNLIERYLPIGGTFLDIGANIGYDTLLASKIVGKYGKVIAIEPEQRNLAELKNNIKINGYSNIEIKEIGAGNSNEDMEIYYNNENPGGSSLIKEKEKDKGEGETIRIRKLDEILLGEKIDFIKMDIEGYEYEAIKGMNGILKKNNVIMIFEYSPELHIKMGKDKQYSIGIIEYLNKLGFILYDITKNGNENKIINTEEYYNFVRGKESKQSDILCIKED